MESVDEQIEDVKEQQEERAEQQKEKAEAKRIYEAVSAGKKPTLEISHKNSNVPYGELENGYAFPKEKMLVFYCDRGGASMAAAREFVRRGYKTRSVIGGFEAYRGRNLVISR